MYVAIALETLRAALSAVLPCVSDDETRQALNSVCVDYDAPTGTVSIVATDGHRLARYTAPGAFLSPTREAATCEPTLISLGEAKGLLAALKGKHAPGAIVVFQKSGRLSAYVSIGGKGCQFLTGVDAQFPPYHHVIPAYHTLTGPDRGAPSIGVNAEYLIDAAKAFHACGKAKGNRTLGVTISTGSNLDPILLTNDQVPELTIVVMPMRIDDCAATVARAEAARRARAAERPGVRAA